MKSRKPELYLTHETDPFLNMIIRPNRSPVLKPVVVSSRTQLQISRSAGSFREKFKLPPISSSRKTQNFQIAPVYDRSNIITPNFKISSKKAEGQTNLAKKIHKPPIYEVSQKKRVMNETKRDFKCLFADVSFGDVDENVSGLNEVMKKYKY